MADGEPYDRFVIEETMQSQERRGSKSHSLSLPPFDEGLGTRKLLKVGFIVSCIWAAILTLAGLALMVMAILDGGDGDLGGEMPTNFPYLANMCTLLFAVITTICTEVLGYIHTISLRWALAGEGKLAYNSNLRLFTTSQISRTNGLWANCLWIFSLILCYGGAVNAVQGDEITDECTISSSGTICHAATGSEFSTEMPSTLIMGIGLTSLCVLTGIGWRAGERSGRIKSWNPHPLNTALVCAHHGFLGRTLKDFSSLHDTGVGRPLRLKLRNASARQLIPSLRHVIRYLFSMSLITLILALIVLIIILVQKQIYMIKFTWSFFPVRNITSRSTSYLMIGYQYNLSEATMSWLSVLWSSCWQVFPSLTFHIAELVVNLYRDETCWRSISSPKGAKFEQNALLAAFSNKGSISLLILKPLGLWIFSLGVFSLGLNPLPLFVLSVLFAVLALSTFVVARYQPKGPLPATYGHLQSIINLVDDWGNGAQGRLWWSDKGCINNLVAGMSVRCMGTSGIKKDVHEIHISEEYVTI